MDVSQYIGSFLLKNRYCSLPGLGVFDLKRTSAAVNNAEGTIQPPTYSLSFNPVGSIDDTFASFIASKENVSIANASNHIRDFCTQVKDQLAKTGQYDVPQLGRFENKMGRIGFTQSKDLNLGMEPVAAVFTEIKVAPLPAEERKLDYSYAPARSTYRGRKNGSSYLKILIPIAAVLLIAVISYFAYSTYQENKGLQSDATHEANPQNSLTPETNAGIDSVQFQTQNSADSVSNRPDTTSLKPSDTLNSAATMPPPPSGQQYRIVVFTTTDQATATAKSQKWARYGNLANVIPMNGSFAVTIDASHPLNDTTKLVDSLRRFFNPKGPVYILK